MPEVLLSTRQLSLTLGRERVLRDVELDVHRGRTLAILGANGAGKSLLLRVLHGLIEPDTGVVSVHGKPLDHTARARQAMVFQRPVMLRRSVQQNLDFAIRTRGIQRSRRKSGIAAALTLARLDHKRHQPARSLSGGEQQRLALARAQVAEPELLFLDEATSSLDPASTAAFEDMLGTTVAKGTTVVLVTHDRHQAARLADDIAFLHEGRVAEQGPAATLLDQPQGPELTDWLEGRLQPVSTHGADASERSTP